MPIANLSSSLTTDTANLFTIDRDQRSLTAILNSKTAVKVILSLVFRFSVPLLTLREEVE